MLSIVQPDTEQNGTVEAAAVEADTSERETAEARPESSLGLFDTSSSLPVHRGSHIASSFRGCSATLTSLITPLPRLLNYLVSLLLP